jgi:hypothetical protein
MGVSSSTQQHKLTFSANRDCVQKFLVYNDKLSNKDIRVALALMCILEGYNLNPTDNEGLTDGRLDRRAKSDPRVFKHIDPSMIAKSLGWNKKEVKKCIKHLLSNDIIEENESEVSGVKNGYRFMF